jgi:hypothetical protein
MPGGAKPDKSIATGKVLLKDVLTFKEGNTRGAYPYQVEKECPGYLVKLFWQAQKNKVTMLPLWS